MTVGNPLGRAVRAVSSTVAACVQRARRSDAVTWFLYSGRRSVVTGMVLVGVFTGFLALAVLQPVYVGRILSRNDTLQTLFSELLAGAILLVSIVTSISSVVLSQEITDIDTEQRRIDASLEFRRHTEELIDAEVSPSRPAEFLEAILQTIYEDALTLRLVAAQGDNREFDEAVRSFTDETLDEAKRAAERLDGAQFGTFEVLSTGLNYDYSWQLTTARRLRREHQGELSDAEIEALSTLVDTLKFFATGREYFQSLYYKREMARLSTTLLYVSLPVIVFVSYMLLALDLGTSAVAAAGVSRLEIFLVAAYTVALAPYAVLTAHVLRIAAITLRTLAAGPFILRQREDHGGVNVELDADPDDWKLPGTSAVGETIVADEAIDAGLLDDAVVDDDAIDDEGLEPEDALDALVPGESVTESGDDGDADGDDAGDGDASGGDGESMDSIAEGVAETAADAANDAQAAADSAEDAARSAKGAIESAEDAAARAEDAAGDDSAGDGVSDDETDADDTAEDASGESADDAGEGGTDRRVADSD